jgi:hypothetical protein
MKTKNYHTTIPKSNRISRRETKLIPITHEYMTGTGTRIKSGGLS